MVIRVGTGFFYNRFNENNTLTANRFNGVNVIQTAVNEPFENQPPGVIEQQLPNVAPIYSVLNQWSPTAVPSVTGVPATQQTTWLVDPNIQIPTVWVLGTQVERQLPRNMTMFVGFFNLRITHVIRARDVNAPLPGTITELTPNGIRPDPTKGEINRFEASGEFNQRQFFIGFNSRFSRMIQVNGNYSWSRTTNDTDGQGGALFPMNSYDLTGEFGRAGFDIRHRFSLFGTVNLPWWKVVVNPFIVANTGPAFNIITGLDRNLDRQFNERPSFAAADAACSLTVRCTPFGKFNLNPLPGETIIPRNYGQAPGAVVVNLRVSRTFAFGVINRGNAAAARPAAPAGGAPSGPASAAAAGGATRVAAVGAGPQGAGAAASEKRYNLNVSINFQNLFNHVNLGPPVGNLSSPSFGESVALGGAFGGFGAPGSTGAGNRRIYAQVRLNF
jgi:hypothetical protein